MRKLLLVMVIGFAILAAGVLSKAGAAEMKIGYCNMDRVINESEEGKKALAGLKEFVSSKQAAVQEKNKKVEKIKSELDKQGTSMSADARKQKIDEFERGQRDIQRAVSDANTDIEIKKRELTESVYKEILETVQTYGQQKQYSIILPVVPLLYGDKSLDITDLIIKKYNEERGYKTPSKR